ncbi:DUF3164 family protein [Pandoraea fibrosis]|uniref:Sulfate transporter n=1 Tax=Pandoraea fibrosis TaxID=1891094 RepID=A0A5E4XGL6_9BURK|nr:DUF3164 family protein [Pandoraea fibrosis]VVE35514.1 sulfate transporter [Pandoraea fibrosis]
MNAQESVTVPAGYLKDAAGRLVPEQMVRPIDRLRDEVVCGMVEKAKYLNKSMVAHKRDAFATVNAFVSMSVEEYGAKVRGTKGNVTLMTFDGRYKVQIANADNIVFDERLQAAKALVDECITEWSEGSDPKIRMLVQQAFETDREGKLNTGRVLALRRLAIDDDKWKRAMQAIGESVKVTGTRSYIRYYERLEGSDEYVPISLDMAAV